MPRAQKSREAVLKKMLKLIRQHPGIRPSELNRRLKRHHSASLRATLIARGFVRKEKQGAAVRYYPPIH